MHAHKTHTHTRHKRLIVSVLAREERMVRVSLKGTSARKCLCFIGITSETCKHKTHTRAHAHTQRQRRTQEFRQPRGFFYSHFPQTVSSRLGVSRGAAIRDGPAYAIDSHNCAKTQKLCLFYSKWHWMNQTKLNTEHVAVESSPSSAGPSLVAVPLETFRAICFALSEVVVRLSSLAVVLQSDGAANGSHGRSFCLKLQGVWASWSLQVLNPSIGST